MTRMDQWLERIDGSNGSMAQTDCHHEWIVVTDQWCQVGFVSGGPPFHINSTSQSMLFRGHFSHSLGALSARLQQTRITRSVGWFEPIVDTGGSSFHLDCAERGAIAASNSMAFLYGLPPPPSSTCHLDRLCGWIVIAHLPFLRPTLPRSHW